MSSSLLRVKEEESRSQSAKDSNFTQQFYYYFELWVSNDVSPSASSDTSYIFPLVVGPNSYQLSEPFSVEKTPTQGGGLLVEENGIVMRTIRLRGNTGFKPRPFPMGGIQGKSNTAQSPNSLMLNKSDRSFSRMLPTTALVALSGQRHFQYLQDSVFRIYGDLKRNPAFSKGVALIFHNPKDDESWVVIPENFVLTRDASKRILYEYDIEMTAVAPASLLDISFSEDKSLLDKIKDKVQAAQAFIDGVSGFVNDVTATIDEARRLVAGIDNLFDGLNALTTAVNDFVTGVTELIKIPAAFVGSLAEAIENVCDTLVNIDASVRSIPSAYLNTWRRLEDSVNRLGNFPGLFETDAQAQLKHLRVLQSLSDRTISTASSTAAPDSIDAFGEMGTAPLPGTADRAKEDLGVGTGVNAYTSATSVTVSQGDTLAGLASKHLGDARLWQDLALLNGLKAPFLETLGTAELGVPGNPIPGILSVGDSILIPNYELPPQGLPLLPVLGVSQERPYGEQLLGVDFVVTVDSDGFVDWVIDSEHGSTDLKLARGVDNLSQGLVIRMTVERGTNPLYRRLGLPRIVGLANNTVDEGIYRLQVVNTLRADPRVAGVSRLDFESGSPDALIIDADVEVRGFSQGVNARAIGVR